MSLMSKDPSRPSIDGFTLKRRTPDSEGLSWKYDNKEVHGGKQQFMRPHVDRGHAMSTPHAAPEILPRPEAVRESGLRRAEIDESLKAVDKPAESKKRKKQQRRWFLKKPVIIGVIILAIGLGGGAFLLSKLASITGRVFSSGNVFDLLGSGTKLKQDTNGWTNILVFGTSEDDKGHDGAMLTDSILVVSLNQEQKRATMVSMPRDMWVRYDTDCQFGYQGKINVVYECAGSINGSLTNIDVAKGANALKKKVGEVFGLDVQYYVKVNYAVVRELTTALGGVTVQVEGAFGAPGIYDAGMGKLLKLPNGPATLQGEQALAFVRARGEAPGSYGLNGNFSREQNQQKMIVAIQKKALSSGTLTNPVAVNSMLESLGNNIRTDISTGEVKTISMLGKEFSADKIVHINLNDEKHPMVNTGMYNGQSIVKPIAGLSDFSKIQGYIQGQMSGGSLESEDATIMILNGSGRAGAASTQQTVLTKAGLLNTTTGNTAYKPASAIVWYDTTGGTKPKTQAKLANLLGKQPTGATLPTGVQSTADFVIIIGDGTN